MNELTLNTFLSNDIRHVQMHQRVPPVLPLKKKNKKKNKDTLSASKNKFSVQLSNYELAWYSGWLLC